VLFRSVATTTTDPDAYALAEAACEPIGDTLKPECALLSYAQWARIESDNAIPWLYLAKEAQRRRDHSTFEAALDRASNSRYSDPRSDQILRLLESDAMDAQSPPVQAQLAVSLVGVWAAFAVPVPSGLMQYCGKPDQANSHVETCTNLAAILIGQSRTALEVSLGGRIAETIGRSDPRVATMRDLADAIRWQWSQHMKSAVEESRTVFSCEGLQRLRRNMAAQAQLGEVGLLRQELADAGVSVSQTAERLRAEIRQQRAEIQQQPSKAE